MGAGLVTLREGFEASLVVAIVLAFLDRSGRHDGFRPVLAGVCAALLVSAAAAAALFAVGAELEGRAEAVFEGATMSAAACLLTWMIFWMRRQARGLRRTLELRVENALARDSALALALVAFAAVLREGVETGLFLLGAMEGTSAAAAAGSGAAGLLAALGLGYLVYRGSGRLDLRRFFTLTSAALLVFAGYLLAAGLHELAEGGALPESEPLFVAAFLGLAGPTLALYLRGNARRAPSAAPLEQRPR